MKKLFAEHKIWINVVSYRNSTSNHNIIPLTRKKVGVVSYRNSTSNHNNITIVDNVISVVSYRNSTSNHNNFPDNVTIESLYLIEILHQTTTFTLVDGFWKRLYLIEILHQTTTHAFVLVRKQRCILSKFYIKPQLSTLPALSRYLLYLIEILHQTTTSGLILIDKVLLTGCLPL